jgi:endonuclease G
MSHKCASCEALAFDAERAYHDLLFKHTQLADIVAQYMSEAHLKRRGRVTSSHELSEKIKMSIIGGEPAPSGLSPECCLVGDVNPSGQFRWYCTGVLIHPGAVLTAAHCFSPEKGLQPNVVALNTRSIGPADMVSAEVIRLKKAPIRNPLYSQFSKTNDVAVLVLAHPAQTPSAVLANAVETTQSAEVRVVGFGSDMPTGTTHAGLKRFVEIPIEFIRHSPQEDLSGVEMAYGFDSELEFVAGGQGRDACYGDSGGPAYVNVGGELKVAGLVSRKVKNSISDCGSGGIYTRVDQQVEFIQSVLSVNNL